MKPLLKIIGLFLLAVFIGWIAGMVCGALYVMVEVHFF